MFFAKPVANFALTMTNITQTKERNRRFTKAVRDEMSRLRLRRATDSVINSVIHSPVEKGFFISVDHLIVMDRRRRLCKLPKMSADNAAMWREIFELFDRYMVCHPGATRTAAAVHVVAHGRASRFYISTKTANRLLNC